MRAAVPLAARPGSAACFFARTSAGGAQGAPAARLTLRSRSTSLPPYARRSAPFSALFLPDGAAVPFFCPISAAPTPEGARTGATRARARGTRIGAPGRTMGCSRTGHAHPCTSAVFRRLPFAPPELAPCYCLLRCVHSFSTTTAVAHPQLHHTLAATQQFSCPLHHLGLALAPTSCR